MYTGIVQAMLPIATVERQPGLMTFALDFDDELLTDLVTGASVAINGVCFTVTGIEGHRVSFDAIAETLSLSNIRDLQPGTAVNVERSARADAEIGGHILSGHVIGTARVLNVIESDNNRRLTFQGDSQWLKYVFNKGFLALNGCSLTVAAIDQLAATFSVNLIPETLARTNFALVDEGDEVNIEIDQQTQAIVDTVERVLAAREQEGKPQIG